MMNRKAAPLFLGGLMLLSAPAAQAGEMMKDGMKHEHRMMDKAMHKMHESKSMGMSEKHMDDGMMKDKGKEMGMDKKDGMSDHMMSGDMDTMKKDRMMHEEKGMMHDH